MGQAAEHGVFVSGHSMQADLDLGRKALCIAEAQIFVIKISFFNCQIVTLIFVYLLPSSCLSLYPQMFPVVVMPNFVALTAGSRNWVNWIVHPGSLFLNVPSMKLCYFQSPPNLDILLPHKQLTVHGLEVSMLCPLLCNIHSDCTRLEHLMRASFRLCFVALGVLIVLLMNVGSAHFCVKWFLSYIRCNLNIERQDLVQNLKFIFMMF